jgi:XRE family transcriptional regulator, regulator of sulfur utilization
MATTHPYGERIRRLRDYKGFSQESMAEMLKMSIKAYSNLELGKNDMSTTRLQQIAEILGVKLDDLIAAKDPFANFFDKCTNTNVNVSNPNQVNTNNFDRRDLEYKNELQTKEIRALNSEKETLKLRAEKAEFEMLYWKEKYEQLKAKIEDE